jgi:hypothetical protein
MREQGIVRGVARLTVPDKLNPPQFKGEKRYWLHPPTSRSRGTTARQALLRPNKCRLARFPIYCVVSTVMTLELALAAHPL